MKTSKYQSFLCLIRKEWQNIVFCENFWFVLLYRVLIISYKLVMLSNDFFFFIASLLERIIRFNDLIYDEYCGNKYLNWLSKFIRKSNSSSSFLFLFFSSDFRSGVGDGDSELLSSLDDLCSQLGIKWMYTLALTLCAISAEKVLLFINKTSRSLMLWTRNFFNPLGKWNLVFLSLR